MSNKHLTRKAGGFKNPQNRFNFFLLTFVMLFFANFLTITFLSNITSYFKVQVKI
jgi:hypothetical protein